MDPQSASATLRKAADYIDAQLAAGKKPSKVRVARIVARISRATKSRTASGPLGRVVEDFYEKTFKRELPDIKWWGTSDFTAEEERALEALYDKISPDDLGNEDIHLAELARDLDKTLKKIRTIRAPKKRPFKDLLEGPLDEAVDAVQKARDAVGKASDAFEDVNSAEQMWWVDISDDFVHSR